TVTTLDDSGPGSLRQAIADAAPGDTIDFAVTGTITLTSGELAITNDLTIAGPGQTRLIVDGNQASRVFGVSGGTNVTVFIAGLTVTHGNGMNFGGGIANGVANFSGQFFNGASLTVSNCCITKNGLSSSGPSPGGGGVANSASSSLTIIDSTISNNGGAYWAGGIMNNGLLTLLRTAVVNNEATVTGGIKNGGTAYATNSTISGNWNKGIDNTSGTSWLQSCTISSNTGYGVGSWSGGICHGAGSIIAGNQAGDLSGPFDSLDYNFIQLTNEATITGVTTHNIYGQDPLLGPLADNGGPTPTHALLPGSPAIDHGSSDGLSADQRGQPRSFGFPAYFDASDGSDIGAYELQERAQTGSVFTVNTTDDADDGVPGIAHCSLREAIAAANANADTNTVAFAVEVPGLHTGVTGTIVLSHGRLVITNDLAITGPGSSHLTISGNRSNGIFGAGIAYQPPPYPYVTLLGLTLANGNDYRGAGVFAHGNLVVSHCTITNCVAVTGSGIDNWQNLVLIDSIVSGNVADTGGGGILNEDGSCAISNCTIAQNAGNKGGGLYVDGGTVTIRNSTVSGNTAGFEGGGIGIYGTGVLQLYNSVVCSNTTSIGSGGGILVGGRAEIGSSIVAGNSAPANPDCGGILNSLDYNLIRVRPKTGVFQSGARHGARRMGGERLIFPPDTFKPPKFSNASDTASVAFDLELRSGRLQAARRSVCARARWRACSSRPITCRL
ncbi:MAG TPA: right-handed parallel beta-helix repeat-containing protein, partial [Verrucomicrobiae bacterium]